jgi:hypothetical protein
VSNYFFHFFTKGSLFIISIDIISTTNLGRASRTRPLPACLEGPGQLQCNAFHHKQYLYNAPSLYTIPCGCIQSRPIQTAVTVYNPIVPGTIARYCMPSIPVQSQATVYNECLPFVYNAKLLYDWAWYCIDPYCFQLSCLVCSF